MNLIFLDVDGVLNNTARKDKNLHSFAPSGCICILDSKMKLLSKLIKETNSKVILSSSWQYDILKDHLDGNFLLEEFKRYGIKIDGFTHPSFPDDFDEDYNELRGKCILRNVKEGDRFIILDDNKFDMENEVFANHLVLTNNKKGLTFSDCELAKSLLEKQKGE